MPLEPVEPRRLYRQIAGQLRRLIDKGEYPVGGRLPTERELADKLNVSRPTVREALIALEVEGRLRIRVGSGIYVLAQQAATNVPSARAHDEGPFEVMRARALVESAVAGEAARGATEEDVARLDAVLAYAERKTLERKRWFVLDRRFHIAIASMLNNPVLVRTVQELFDQRNNIYFDRLAQHTENASTWKAAHQEHRAIRDAIASRSPTKARAAMTEHLERSQERYTREFAEPPMADGKAGSLDTRTRPAGRKPKPAVARKMAGPLQKVATCQ